MTRQIGLLGAYSIDNPGDALLGYAARLAVQARWPGAEVRLFAPALPEPLWGHAWGTSRGLGLPITRIPADGSITFADGLDALVIGGGGIVSPSPAFRPFLLGDPERWPADVPAAWNAVCSQNQPSWLPRMESARASVRRCCERLAYVSVRNATTERYLRGCGYAGDVHVVPDLVFGLQGPTDPAVSAEVDAALADAGLEVGAPLLGVSVGRALGDSRAHGFFKELFGTLQGIQRAPGGPAVVVIPFGSIYGDLDQQRIAAEALGVPCLRPLSPLSLWELVSRLELYVCTRLHGMLAAFAQQVPFVVLDEYLSNELGTSKIREVVADAGLERCWLSPLLPGAPGWKLQAVWEQRTELGLDALCARERGRLDVHWDALLTALDEAR